MGFKYKTAGTGKTTVQALSSIWDTFTTHDAFMADGGSHFNNAEVRALCSQRGAKVQVVAAYAPWVNGLVE